MADNPKPTDFLSRMADRDFPQASVVDVATVPKDKKADELLFGAARPPAGDGGGEGGGDEDEDAGFFIWTEEAEVVARLKAKGQKPGVNPDTQAEGFWYHDVIASGRTQRFYGATRTAVAKALDQAQVHATVAIDEFKKKHANNPPPPQNTTPTQYDDKPWDTKLPYNPIQFAPAQALNDQQLNAILELNQTNPLEAQRRMFQVLFGASVQQIQEVLLRIDQSYGKTVANEAAFEFQANHIEDWDPTSGNQRAMTAYLNSRNLPVTLTNLEKAFQDLKALGKLTMPKPEEEATPPGAVTTPPAAELVEEVEPPPPPVSVQHRPAPGSGSERQTQQTDREVVANLTSMPLADMRDTIQSAMRKHRGGGR